METADLNKLAFDHIETINGLKLVDREFFKEEIRQHLMTYVLIKTTLATIDKLMKGEWE